MAIAALAGFVALRSSAPGSSAADQVVAGGTTEPPTSTSTPTTSTPPTSTPPTSTTTTPTTVPFPSFRADEIAPLSAEVTDFIDFLAAHPNDIVEVDVKVGLASLDDYLQVDGDDRTTWHLALYDDCFNPLDQGEPPNALDCGGYSLVFLDESAGTSAVGLHRGTVYRIFGYFSVGPLVGPNQGIFSIPLDPVSPADALG